MRKGAANVDSDFDFDGVWHGRLEDILTKEKKVRKGKEKGAMVEEATAEETAVEETTDDHAASEQNGKENAVTERILGDAVEESDGERSTESGSSEASGTRRDDRGLEI